MQSRPAISILIWSIVLFVFGSASVIFAQELVKAKIGVEIYSGEQTFPAKKRVRLKLGDAFRVYVMPEKDCYVYVINSDKKVAVLLNPNSQKVPKGSLKFFPSMKNRFQPDGLVAEELLTVICSPKKLKRVVDLFASGSAPSEQWASLKKKLANSSRISLNEETSKPVPLAGNVRGHEVPFVEQMRTSSGKSLLLKSYYFHVKK